MVGVAIFGRNLGLAPNDPAFKCRNLVGYPPIYDDDGRYIAHDISSCLQCRKRCWVKHHRAKRADEWHAYNGSYAYDARESLDIFDCAALGLVDETAWRVPGRADAKLPLTAQGFEIVDEPGLILVRSEIEQPHTGHKSFLTPWAVTKNISRVESFASI